LIDKEIDELVPVPEPESEQNHLKRSKDECPGCMLDICNIHDIHNQPKKSKVDESNFNEYFGSINECIACDLGLCSLNHSGM
jgi:hypothetical protein